MWWSEGGAVLVMKDAMIKGEGGDTQKNVIQGWAFLHIFPFCLDAYWRVAFSTKGKHGCNLNHKTRKSRKKVKNGAKLCKSKHFLTKLGKDSLLWASTMFSTCL